MTDIVERVRITDKMLRAACDAERVHDGASPCHFCPEQCSNEGLAAAIRAALNEASDEIEQLRAALREARKALRYWGPVTGHGFSEKARIGAIIDAALGEDAK